MAPAAALARRAVARTTLTVSSRVSAAVADSIHSPIA
jgi:hypothetical protein